MATYNNQHWLLSHIRNSFISTDDTGLCETVMISDDLPKQFLHKLHVQKRAERTMMKNSIGNSMVNNSISDDIPIATTATVDDGNESVAAPSSFNDDHDGDCGEDLFCYPGLDQSDDEDLDLASQSFDIPMYPEIGAHRYRSNTAQKLEKMEIARRKAARIKNIKVDDSNVGNNNGQDINDDILDKLFIKKDIPNKFSEISYDCNKRKLKSRLVEQLMSCPKKPQNRFIQYARFDGASQTGIPTKNLNIFLSMLPANQRNYPMKICVAATAKIQEVIGFICYKCNIINPEIQLQSVRHYGLYISEDNGEMDTDFPPLDLREPCSKFGFTCLTLAELRPTAHITRVDYRSLSMTSEIEAAGEAAIADVQGMNGNNQSDDMARMLGHNSMIEAPLYRTFRLHIIVKGFFRVEVQLGISGERLEIDPVQQKNSKFWTRQKAISYNIESIAYCEIIEQKGNKTILRLWYLHGAGSGSGSSNSANLLNSALNFYSSDSSSLKQNLQSELLGIGCSTSSPQHTNFSASLHHFKYYDFETDNQMAQQILNKINFILEVRSSVIRREFLNAREKKKDKITTKKLLMK